MIHIKPNPPILGKPIPPTAGDESVGVSHRQFFILNGNTTPMGFVVSVLGSYLGLSPEESNRTMLDIHTRGGALLPRTRIRCSRDENNLGHSSTATTSQYLQMEEKGTLAGDGRILGERQGRASIRRRARPQSYSHQSCQN